MFGLGRKTECDRVGDRLSEYVDGRLSGKALQYVEWHLSGCESCAKELAELRTTVEILRGVDQAAAPRSFAIDSAMLAKRERPQLYGERALRLLRPALAVSVFIFIVMLFVDFGLIVTGERGADMWALSSGGFDWRFVLRIMEWSWGCMVIAFALAFIYVSWRRHRGYPDLYDSNDILR